MNALAKYSVLGFVIFLVTRVPVSHAQSNECVLLNDRKVSEIYFSSWSAKFENTLKDHFVGRTKHRFGYDVLVFRDEAIPAVVDAFVKELSRPLCGEQTQSNLSRWQSGFAEPLMARLSALYFGKAFKFAESKTDFILKSMFDTFLKYPNLNLAVLDSVFHSRAREKNNLVLSLEERTLLSTHVESALQNEGIHQAKFALDLLRVVNLPRSFEIQNKIISLVAQTIESSEKYSFYNSKYFLADPLNLRIASNFLSRFSGNEGSPISAIVIVKLIHLFGSEALMKRLVDPSLSENQLEYEMYTMLADSLFSFVSDLVNFVNFNRSQFSSEEILTMAEELQKLELAKPKYIWSGGYNGNGRSTASARIQFSVLALLKNTEEANSRVGRILIKTLDVTGNSDEKWYFNKNGKDYTYMTIIEAVENIKSRFGDLLPNRIAVEQKLNEVKSAKPADHIYFRSRK